MNPSDLDVALFALACFAALIACPTWWISSAVWRRRMERAEMDAGRIGFAQGIDHGRLVERMNWRADDLNAADWWKR